jgi:hypothetical protein
MRRTMRTIPHHIHIPLAVVLALWATTEAVEEWSGPREQAEKVLFAHVGKTGGSSSELWLKRKRIAFHRVHNSQLNADDVRAARVVIVNFATRTSAQSAASTVGSWARGAGVPLGSRRRCSSDALQILTTLREPCWRRVYTAQSAARPLALPFTSTETTRRIRRCVVWVMAGYLRT